MKSILIDSNVLIHLYDTNSDPHKYIAPSLLYLYKNGYRLTIFPQNIVEFWSVATRDKRGLNWTVKRTYMEIKALQDLFYLQMEPEGWFKSWLSRVVKNESVSRKAYDARLVTMMVHYGIGQVLTSDRRDFSAHTDIGVLSPKEICETHQLLKLEP